MVDVHGDTLGGDPLDQLHTPSASAMRVVGRDLEVAMGAAQAPAFERRLWEALHGTAGDALDSAVYVESDLLAYFEWRDGEGAPRAEKARGRLALLLAASGDTAGALALAAQAGDDGALANDLRFVYGEGGRPPGETFAALLAAQDSWLASSVQASLDARMGKADAARAERTRRQRRSSRGYRAARHTVALGAALVLAGVLVLAGWAVRRGSGAPGLGGPPWTLADGLAVFVRADVWNRLFFAGLARLPVSVTESSAGEFLWQWSTLLASLPLVWLAHRHLARPHRLARPAPFGLRPGPRELPHLAAISLAALAIDLTGTYALASAGFALGFEGHWSEGLDEVLIWGAPASALLTAVDYVVWAPLFEELAFRGVLYFSLRSRLGPVPAALASAILFGAVHFYSVPGFAGTLWSGLVWAWVYERSRSLVPGIAAHAVYNGLYVLGQVTLYR